MQAFNLHKGVFMKKFIKKLVMVMGLLFMASGYAAEGALGDDRIDKKAEFTLKNDALIYAVKELQMLARNSYRDWETI